MVVSGLGASIELYEHNGTDYIINQSIASKDLIVGSVSFAEENSIMVYGGIKGRLRLFERVNGTYEFQGNTKIGAYIYEVKLEPGGLYFITVTNTPAIEVMYNCPTVCLNCTFPNNCSACINGYHLEGVQCRQDYTHCVQNRMIKDNICE